MGRLGNMSRKCKRLSFEEVRDEFVVYGFLVCGDGFGVECGAGADVAAAVLVVFGNGRCSFN